MGHESKVELEHDLSECFVSPTINADGIRLFRAPVIHDSAGFAKRLPMEVDWCHLQEGDIVFAISLDKFGNSPNAAEFITCLEFWKVLRLEDDGCHIRRNSFVVHDGGLVFDKMAGMVGVNQRE